MLPFDRKGGRRQPPLLAMGLGPKAQQYPMHSAFWEGLWFLVENKDTGVKAGVCGNMNVNNQSAA